MPEKSKTDLDYIVYDPNGKKTLNLHILGKAMIQQCMGKCLDYARVSGMSDRSLQQFERLVKDDFYRVIELYSRLLAENGHIDKK